MSTATITPSRKKSFNGQEAQADVRMYRISLRRSVDARSDADKSEFMKFTARNYNVSVPVLAKILGISYPEDAAS